MPVYYCTDHDTFWPVGCASIVRAKDEKEAQEMLDAALKKRGLKPFAGWDYTLKELGREHQAVILVDGNY